MHRPWPPIDEDARRDLCEAAAALDAAELAGRPADMSRALARLAQCHGRLRAWAGAEVYLEMALRWARCTASTDGVVELLCELSQTAALLARAQDADRCGEGRAARERARDHAFEASTLAGRVADPAWEVKVLLRISDVLDQCGDHEDAAQLQSRALRLLAGCGSAAAEAAQLPALGRLADG